MVEGFILDWLDEILGFLEFVVEEKMLWKIGDFDPFFNRVFGWKSDEENDGMEVFKKWLGVTVEKSAHPYLFLRLWFFLYYESPGSSDHFDGKIVQIGQGK